jgi:hypothetical protein
MTEESNPATKDWVWISEFAKEVVDRDGGDYLTSGARSKRVQNRIIKAIKSGKLKVYQHDLHDFREELLWSDLDPPPSDDDYVTKRTSIEAWWCSARAGKPTVQQGLSTREAATHLRIIGALLELIKTPKTNRDSNSAVIAEIVQNYGDKPGISARTLEKKFAEAKRTLEAD